MRDVKPKAIQTRISDAGNLISDIVQPFDGIPYEFESVELRRRDNSGIPSNQKASVDLEGGREGGGGAAGRPRALRKPVFALKQTRARMPAEQKVADARKKAPKSKRRIRTRRECSGRGAILFPRLSLFSIEMRSC